MDSRKRKAVYGIVERGGRVFWRPLGVGFVNADGSIDVRLEVPPECEVLQIRDPRPRGAAQEARS